MGITTRPALDADTDFARLVHHRAYRDVVVRQYGVWEEEAQDEFFENDWETAAFEIILCDGVPCGYTRIEDRDGDIHVRELVILPEFQGRGIGSQILRGVIERAKARRVPVRLGTHHANRAAELYQKLGFREFERTATHILMEWSSADRRLILKTVGVLGGISPQATMDFEARVHAVSQRLIPQHINSGYPPMVVYYCRFMSILLNEDSTPQLPIRSDPRLLEAAGRLGALADFLVITSNGTHLFREQIEQASGRKVLSMIEATLEDVRRRGWRRVGVLGFGDPAVYTRPLGELSIECETIDGELRAKLDAAILRVMEGRDDAEQTAAAREAVASLRAREVDGIILGCTEIPLLLRESAEAPDLLNPLQLLAEATVRYAAGEANVVAEQVG